jgi:hypothetical protein
MGIEGSCSPGETTSFVTIKGGSRERTSGNFSWVVVHGGFMKEAGLPLNSRGRRMETVNGLDLGEDFQGHSIAELAVARSSKEH